MSSGLISSLDLTLRRMSSIENNFNRLGVEEDKPVLKMDKAGEDFRKILDEKISPTDDKTSLNIEKADDKKLGSKENIEELILKYANENNLDADFVKAVVKQESGFNPNATSKCGAMGLMQLMPQTARALGVVDAYNPEQNIQGGVKYLKSMMTRFDNDPKLALAAYNAGPGAVQKYGDVPPYRETQNYVKNIMASWEKIKGGEV